MQLAVLGNGMLNVGTIEEIIISITPAKIVVVLLLVPVQVNVSLLHLKLVKHVVEQ